MNKLLLNLTLLMGPALLPTLAQAAAPTAVTAEEWARPRSGEMLTQLEPVRNAVRSWMDSDGATLVIRYPGGEEGGLSAGELRSWLIALGIPGTHVELQPGSTRADAMELEIRP